MSAAKLLFSFVVFVFGSSGWSQSIESLESPTPEAQPGAKSYKFEKTSGKGKKESFATLRFLDLKDLVRLEFEGHGMEKGKYQIVKTENCDKLRRRLLSNKPIFAGETSLIIFTTEYGQISTEKNFNGQKMQDLGLETTALALVKMEKNGNRFLACAE